MDREQFRLKREQFKQDMHRLSEEKTRQLFEKDEDRETWVQVIRQSVEKEIESRVRQALGTPPKERQRKKLEELTAKRLAKIEEEKRAIACSIMNSRTSLGLRNEEDDQELLWLRKEKYLEKFNRRRTMRSKSGPNFTMWQRNNTTYNKSKIDSEDSNASNTSPIVWKSCEIAPTDLPDTTTQFKRGFDTNFASDSQTDVPPLGPYFPTGRLPCMSAPKHLQSMPSFVENLNTPGQLLKLRFWRSHGGLVSDPPGFV